MPAKKTDPAKDGDTVKRRDRAPVQAPAPIPCEQCKQEIPADEAIQPEGVEYAVYFCSPACFAAWRREQADAVERRHREHSGTDQRH
jgi:hypothetical protein